MIVYKITNLVNGKIRIGQTRRSLNERWSEYWRGMCPTEMYHELIEYGKENFTIEQIDTANSLEELNKKENNLKL